MEAANIVQLPEPVPEPAHVRVQGDRIFIARPRPCGCWPRDVRARNDSEDERTTLVERALRIGLIALQDAGTSMDVDVVRKEFDAMLRQAEAINERVASQVDEVLRKNFADGDGRLPRTLESFLGDRGQLRSFTRELFDEDRRDSAIGRLRSAAG